ncbi:MAG: sulfotransferase domain-containing protein [bacterium]|nr:sulfotransferase domain-containing protein [bacterium]
MKNESYTVSGRNLTHDISISSYLLTTYPFLPIKQIKSIFGFYETPCKLYGGRIFLKKKRSFSDQHIKEMQKLNISVSLNLTNHFFDKNVYNESSELLNKFHIKGNSLVIVNDELAKQIKKDYPLYKINASMIKNINSHDKIEKALNIYDYVVLPMELNENIYFLKNIRGKERIILFSHAGCGYNCPKKICYKNISEINYGRLDKSSWICSKKFLPRKDLGNISFDIENLFNLGFSNFKGLSSIVKKNRAYEAAKYFTHKKYSKEPAACIYSYPKSGRTWLRFILVNYLNLFYKLDIEVNLKSMFELIPNDYEGQTKGIDTFNYYKFQNVPLITASHKKQYSDKTKNIIILRSPFDILVSDYYQNKYHIESYKGDMKSFIRNNETGIYRLCRYLNYILQKNDKKNALIISYEELTNNNFNSVKKVLDSLKIEVKTDILYKAIELSSFERMSKSEEIIKIPGIEYDASNVHSRRIRKGSVGSYINEFDSEDIDYIENIMQRELNQKQLDILKLHKCL